MKLRFIIATFIFTLLVFAACRGIRPEITSFKADPSKIENGGTVKLSWDVRGAKSLVIDQEIGDVPLKGTLEVKPAEITAYNLTAKNDYGTIASAVIINVLPIVQTSSPTSTPQTQPDIAPINSETLESHVYFNGAIMVGADEHYITLRNNPAARNPTWQDLKAFLKKDETDKQAYIAGRFTCGDFSEMLHNNAEAAGIRAAIVAVELKPASLPGGVINHSLNAFETTDRGIVYIDATSSSQGLYADKTVDVAVNREYIPVAIFPQTGWSQAWSDMGRIEAIDIFQW
jgi:hypothetical protein